MTIRCSTSGFNSETKGQPVNAHTLLETTQAFIEGNVGLVYIVTSVIIVLGAFVVLPKVLRKVHEIEIRAHGYAKILGEDGRRPPRPRAPYEASVWKAVELPARVFFTIFTLMQIGRLLFSSSATAAEHLPGLRSGGGVLCFAWFLHRWKELLMENWGRSAKSDEKERYHIIDKLASSVVVVVAGMGIAQALDVSISSLLALGGVGGLMAAYASQQLLSNMLNGFHLSFAKPFVPGDSIKAGSVEGEVDKVGFTATRMRTPENSQIIVPNAFFASQAITNTSREPWRRMERKIPMKISDLEGLRQITPKIRQMLNQKRFLFAGKDEPECRVSRVSVESWEIEISCTFAYMSKAAYLVEEENIFLDAVQIMLACGAAVGGLQSSKSMP